MSILDSLRDQYAYLDNRVEFALDGWRRLAYWLAVMFIGVSIGIRYGHPDLALYPWDPVSQPSLAIAQRAANGFALIAAALVFAIVGRNGFIKDGETDGE